MTEDQKVCGLDIDAMPDGWTPLEAYVILKCLDENSRTALWTQATDGVASWDAVGMLTAALDLERGDLRAGFVDDDDPPDTFGGS